MSKHGEKTQTIEMKEVRKWEDMEYDCLVNILGRVGKVSLLLEVPFVCKSWHKTSLDPSLWKNVDCTEFCNYPKKKLRRFANGKRPRKFNCPGLIKLMVSRGKGMSTSLVLPSLCRQKDLEFVAEKCPELKSLSLEWKDWDCPEGEFAVPKLIPKWKKLEELSLSAHFEGLFCEVVTQIGKNCENFHSLVVTGGVLEYRDITAITKHLPKIKKLSLCKCNIEAEDLETVVLCSKELEALEVESCELGDNWNEEKIKETEEKIKELTSHINTVNVVFPGPYDDYVYDTNLIWI